MIEIKNAPAIPELLFRPLQGEEDYAQIAAVLAASEAADHVERKVSAADIANAYQHLNHCDPLRDMILAEIKGKIVGYARGWWESDSDSGRIYHHNGFLVPEWRRKGIGLVMLRWMESHLAELAQSQHENTLVFQANVTQFQEGAARLLQGADYQPIRYFYEMVRPTLDDIVAFPLLEGLEVRPVTPKHYLALWQAVVEASKDEWGYSEPTEDDFLAWQASPHFQPHLWQVAWDIHSDQIVGHVLTFIDQNENQQRDRKRGYTEGIGVDRHWRRRGIARALISLSLQAQKAAGMRESALVADSDSTSSVIALYESCGFRIVKRDTIYRKYL